MLRTIATWVLVLVLGSLAGRAAVATYAAAQAAPRVRTTAAGETFVQPIRFGMDGRWLRLTSLTVTPTAEIVRGVMHLRPGDSHAQPTFAFAAGQPQPTEFWGLPHSGAVTAAHATAPFRLVYPRNRIVPAAHGKPLQFRGVALTFTRTRTLTRALTLPLAPHGATLGRVPGAVVRLTALSPQGATLTVDYAAVRRVTYGSGVFGSGAAPVDNRMSILSMVSSLALRLRRRSETASTEDGVAVAYPVTRVYLSWNATMAMPGRGERIVVSVPVLESYTVPGRQGGGTWPTIPWWWNLEPEGPRPVGKGAGHRAVSAPRRRAPGAGTSSRRGAPGSPWETLSRPRVG